jgi:hypothetical protein
METKRLKSLDDLIGNICNWKYKESIEDNELNDVWDDECTIECEIIEYEIVLEETFPNRLDVRLFLNPLEENVLEDDEVLDIKRNGVSIQMLRFHSDLY